MEPVANLSPALERLNRRVDRLERDLGRWRGAALAGFALVIAGALTAQTSEPRSGPVVVSDGTHTARLTARGLTVSGSDRRSVFAGLDGNDSPSFDVHGSDGKLRETMYAYQGQRPQFVMFDLDEKKRIVETVGSANLPEISLQDTSEKARVVIQAAANGGWVSVREPSGVARAHFGAYTDGTYGVDLRNGGDTVLWKAP